MLHYVIIWFVVYCVIIDMNARKCHLYDKITIWSLNLFHLLLHTSMRYHVTNFLNKLNFIEWGYMVYYLYNDGHVLHLRPETVIIHKQMRMIFCMIMIK